MLKVLIDTFGQELKVKGEEIESYLKKCHIKVQSSSLPFRSIEPLICWMMILQKENGTPEDMAYLGYYIGSADVPCIPIVFVGQGEQVPREMTGLDNVFCAKKENLEAILKPLIAAFLASKDTFEIAHDSRVDARLKLREKLITEVINAM